MPGFGASSFPQAGGATLPLAYDDSSQNFCEFHRKGDPELMKRTYILAGLVLALTLSAFGQKQKSTPDDAEPKTKKASKTSNNGSDKGTDAASLPSAGTSLEAQPESVIDVRKSEVGDQVILKTTKAIKQNGEVIVPKGANLVGRITEIKRKTKDDATSKVGMVFERIQGKNLDLPVNASVVSIVSGSASAAAAGDLFAADAMGTGASSGSARTNSGGGGGLLGGVGSTVGSVVNTSTSTVGSVAGTATNTVHGTTGTVGRTVNGLQISQSASGSASSSSNISAQGRDVRVEKGATFNL